MQPDARTHYGTISRLLHWGMALAILLMFLMAIAWHINARWQSLIPVHKTLGNALLMLVLFRGIWAIASEQRPRPEPRRMARPPRALPADDYRAEHRAHP